MPKENWRKVAAVLSILSLVGSINFNMKQKEKENIAYILESIPSIDTIIARDSETKEEILKITHEEPSFNSFNLADIYKGNIPIALKRSERRKLLKGKPFIEIDFLENNHVKYTVSVYRFNEKPNLPERGTFITIDDSHSTLTENKGYYIFAVKEYNQLLVPGLRYHLEKILGDNKVSLPNEIRRGG